jgi:hypothetical protein
MKHKLSPLAAGFALYETVLVILVLIVLVLAGYFIFHDSNTNRKTTSSTSSKSAISNSSNLYSVLSPATVPSKAPECSTPISFQSTGNSGPVQCTNGNLNVTEWNALAALEPTVMSLGYSATPSQIQAALCKDANASDSDANTTNSFIVEGTVYQITALYYGWNFASNPSVVLTNGSC